jgi:hypothetical protein
MNAKEYPMNRRLLMSLGVGLALLVIGSILGYYFFGEEPAQARIVQVYGQVERIDGSNRHSQLQLGDLLDMGETVVSGPESGATLAFVDDSRLTLDENSEVVLTHLLAGRSRKSSNVRLLLNAGDAESNIPKDSGFSIRYEVVTPALQLAVRGTQFIVKVDKQTGRTRTMVLRGSVRAEGAAGGSVSLGAGEGLVANVGEPLGQPHSLPAAPQLGEFPAQVERLPLTLTWSMAAPASQYRLDLLDSSTAAPRYSMKVSKPAAMIPEVPDTEYLLRIRGIDEQGLEGAPAEVRFSLNAHPRPPHPESPVAEQVLPATGKVRLVWNSVKAAERYRVQVSSQADFSTLLSDVQELPASLTRLSLRLQPGRYYWRAASWNQAEGFGPFSDVQAFRVSATVPGD